MAIKRTDFSDRAKKKHGIAPSSFAEQFKAEAARHAAEERQLQSKIDWLQNGVSAALTALLEGRRGDAVKQLKTLCSVAWPPPKVTADKTDPGAA